VAKTVVAAGQWRLKAVRTRRGTSFGRMCPPIFGGRPHHALTRGRGWDQNRPSRLLGARPKPTWGRPLPHRGQDRLVTLWPHVEDKRPATRRRWQWPWVSDDRVCNNAGRQRGLGGTWESGQDHRVRRGMAGVRLSGGLGAGKLVIPVDCPVRRPDPGGPGRPGRDPLPWRHVRLARPWTAVQRLGLALPAPRVVAERWFGDSQGLAHVASHQRGTAVVGGTRTSGFRRPDGRRVPGQALLTPVAWPWRDSLQLAGMRSVRLTATSPTFGSVPGVIVQAPGQPRA
jgi:hypothetical protein